MKTTSFNLGEPKYKIEGTESAFSCYSAHFTIPSLPAYAISSHSLAGINADPVNGYVFSASEIINDKLIVHGMQEIHQYLFVGPSVLTINYIGIRDYKLLFPQIENKGIKERVACFMEEADKNFDQCSWLSFAIMAGAANEGLFNDLTEDVDSTFGKLITKTKRLAIFEDSDYETLEFLVDSRNLIHAGRYKDEYISRNMAMKVRLSLDELIKADWCEIRNKYNGKEEKD